MQVADRPVRHRVLCVPHAGELPKRRQDFFAALDLPPPLALVLPDDQQAALQGREVFAIFFLPVNLHVQPPPVVIAHWVGAKAPGHDSSSAARAARISIAAGPRT